jgi:hypothetical protein
VLEAPGLSLIAEAISGVRSDPASKVRMGAMIQPRIPFVLLYSKPDGSSLVKRTIHGPLLPPSELIRIITQLIARYLDSTGREVAVPMSVSENPMSDMFGTRPGKHLLESITREALANGVILVEWVARLLKCRSVMGCEDDLPSWICTCDLIDRSLQPCHVTLMLFVMIFDPPMLDLLEVVG